MPSGYFTTAFLEGKLNGAGGSAVRPEELEPSRLCDDNLRLKRKNEIPKKATTLEYIEVFFSPKRQPSIFG